MAELANGSVIVEARHDHQAPAPERPIIMKSRAALPAAELARLLAADPQGEAVGAGADSDTFDVLAQLNDYLDDAELEPLSDAVDHHNDVLIVYRDKNGSRSTRAIRPQQLYGSTPGAICATPDEDFTIANIEAVGPAR